MLFPPIANPETRPTITMAAIMPMITALFNNIYSHAMSINFLWIKKLMKVLFVIILTLQLIIPLNTAFGLFSYDSINQRADFVESEKDPYDYVLQYKSDKEFKKWFDENYPDITIYNAVGLEEPVIITKSGYVERTIVDGKWSNGREWKESADEGWYFEDGNALILRSAHQDEYIYFLVDFVSDRTHDTNMDRAMICLDPNNDKSKISKSDDYCFVSSIGSTNPVTLQGGTDFKNTGHFKQIKNHDGLIAIGAMSDENDRYSKIPHATYEYKIPLEIISKSDVYGFYILIYDNDKKEFVTWPIEQVGEKHPHIASPDHWGTLVSPDKSIPEFEFPMLILVIFSAIMIGITLKTKSAPGTFSIFTKI